MRAALLALLLGPLLAPLGVSQDVGPGIVLDGDALRHVPSTLRVQGASVAANLLQNPSFDEGFSAPWRFTVTEVGSGGAITIQENALYVQASNVAKNGSLHAMQPVAKPDHGTYHFSYRAASLGRDAMTAAFILRERTLDGRNLDTTFSHALTSTMQLYEWTWQPKVEGGDVQVFIRMRASVGLEQAARVDDIELRRGPEVQWSVENGRILSSGGLSAQVIFDQLGSHSVQAVASRLGESQWEASGTIQVSNVVPTADLVTSPATPPFQTPFLLSAAASSDADSVLRLTDSTFEQQGSAWQATARETGGRLTALRSMDALGRPVLTLGVNGAVTDGTVFASHSVPVHRLEPASFTVGVRDDGNIQRYAFILRERNATGATTDTTYRFEPTNGEERVASMVWTPQRTDTVGLQVYLRYRVLAGASAQVSFIQPNLQSGLTYSYYLDGQHLGTTNNATWPVTLHDLEAHEARVEVRDPDGAASNATLLLRANDAGYTWNVRGSQVLPLSPPRAFDAAGTRRSDDLLNHIRNPSFAAGKQGWTLGPGETGGQVTFDVVQDSDGPLARLSVQGDKAGSNYFSQELDRRCLQMECRFSFAARLIEGDATLEPILRATVQPPGQAARTVDLRYNPSLGSQWTYNETSWSPPTDDVVRLQAYLRIRTPANGFAVVDFRDVRLGPERTFTWAVQGPDGLAVHKGPIIQPHFESPGAGSMRIQLATDLGLGVSFDSSHAFAFDVLPVAFFRTHDGLGIQVTGDRTGATASLVHANGSIAWTRPITTASQDVDGLRQSLDDGSAYLLIDSAPGDRLILHNGTAQGIYPVYDLLRDLQPSIGQLEMETVHSGWGSRLEVRAPKADPSIVRAVVTLRSGSQVLASQEASLAGESLQASLALPSMWRDRGFLVTVTTEDVWGRSSTRAVSAEASDNPVLLPSAVVLLVVAVLVAAGVLSRILHRGGKP